MENHSKLTLKKIIIISVAIILLLILAQGLWRYYHTGKVIITTNSSQNKITLSPVTSKNVGGETSNALQSNGHLVADVSLGRYEISVSNGKQNTNQIITLVSHKTLSYNIDLVGLLTVQPIINTQAQDITVSSNQLFYLNTNDGNINEIDSNNNLSVISSTTHFQTLKWANANYGVGQDSKQNLYLINSGTVKQLSLPFSKHQAISYDVANNKQIYVSYGSSVFIGDQSNNFKKVYSVPSSNLILGGSVNKVAVAYSLGDKGNNAGVMLAVVNSSGQSIKTTVGDDISLLKWSPNNQYIASVNESSVNIYSNSLHLVATIPTNLPTGFLSWINNSEFVYAVGSKIWAYNLANDRADLLANAPLDSSISGLAVSPDGAYVYIATINTVTDSNSAILSIGLKGQQAPTIAYQLQVILPMTLTDSTIGLVDFSQPPTILIVPLSPQSNLSQSHYIQEAQSQLQQDGFNINLLRFSVFP